MRIIERFNPLDHTQAREVIRVEKELEHVLGFFVVGDDGRTFGAMTSAFKPEHTECQSCMSGAGDVLWMLCGSGGIVPNASVDVDGKHGLSLSLADAMWGRDIGDIKERITAEGATT
jgi:hypothetical protein